MTGLTLSVDALAALDACSDGVDDLRSVLAELDAVAVAVDVSIWTPAHQVGALLDPRVRRWLGRLWEHGPLGGVCRYACGEVCRPGCERYARHILRARRIGWRAAAEMVGE